MAVTFNRCKDFKEFEQLLVTPFQSFSVVHVNIRSLRKYWDQFKVLVNEVLSRIDVFVVSESNVPEALWDLFQLPGYNSFWFSRQYSSGGGLVVYVKKEWVVSRHEVAFNYVECIFLKIENSCHSLSLLACYRPPSKSVRQFLQELSDILAESYSQGLLFIVGDINIDLLKDDKSEVCDYLNTLASAGIQNTISSPTREEFMAGRLVSSCIDHILVRTLDTTVRSAVISQKLADHFFVGCQMVWQRTSGCAKNSRQTLEIFDRHIMDSLASSYDWSSFLKTVSYSDVYRRFVVIHDSFKSKAQRNVVLKKRKSDCVWLSADILSAIAEKEMLWARCRRSPANAQLREVFRATRNKVNALVRSAKRIHFQREFSKNRFNISKTWSLANGLRGCHGQRSLDDVVVKNFGDDTKGTAEKFNAFFAASSEQTLSGSAQELTLKATNCESAFLYEIDEVGLRSALFSIKWTRSPGADGITVGFLQRNFDSLKHVLLFMLNGFIQTCSIPEALKMAIVRPISKGGQSKAIENYRPISILPVLGHLLEKHLFVVMNSFLDSHPIMSASQYGFVPGKGTQLLLDDVADFLNSAFDDNMFSCALFLDVSKAFDTVNHDILLRKLFKIGFRGPFFALLSDVLSNRSQRVRVGSELSSVYYLRAGVPQGSVLSPLLFNIYVNDLVSVTSGCKCYQYADDTLLISRHVNFDSACNNLQTNASRVVDWYSSNLLKINPGKTKLICFRNPLKHGFRDVPFYLRGMNSVSGSGVPVQWVGSAKYMGLIFECDMSWNKQLAYICRALRNVACLLYNIRVLVPFHVRKILVHALAYSVLRYGVTVFAHSARLWHEKVNCVLKCLLKSVAYNSNYSNSTNLFTDLEMPNFCSIYQQTVILRYFWTDNYKIPHVPSRILRQSIRFEKPRCFTRFGMKTRDYYVPDTFNQLPDCVFSLDSKTKVKKWLRAYMSDVV